MNISDFLLSALSYLLNIAGVLLRGLYSIISTAPGYTVGAIVVVIFGYHWYYTDGFAESIQQLMVLAFAFLMFIGFVWYKNRGKKKKKKN